MSQLIKKADYFNVWRDALVSEDTLKRITALLETLKSQDSPEGRVAANILHRLRYISYYPNWHEVDTGTPKVGNDYYCVDEEGYTFLAEYSGLDDNGRQMWFVYANYAFRVYPTYWMRLPHTPYDDLRDPLRDPSER